MKKCQVIVVVVLCMMLCTCVERNNKQNTTDDIYGTTSVPFRGRWWHYQERGISWALGEHWTQAEKDLRACLRIRQTDSRRARTYGMHFVQCFAHRELGGILLEQGRYEEAAQELRISMEQEPSAKAASLLQACIDKQKEARSDHVLYDNHIISTTPKDSKQEGTELVKTVSRLSRQLVITEVVAKEAEAQHLECHGFIEGVESAMLSVWDAAGDVVKTIEVQGNFVCAVEKGGSLSLEQETKPEERLTIEIRPTASLTIDGVQEGDQLHTDLCHFGYRVSGLKNQQHLVVFDNEQQIKSIQLQGESCRGHSVLSVSKGIHALRFVLIGVQGEISMEQTITIDVSPPPNQMRLVRAPAFIVPPVSPQHGIPLSQQEGRMYGSFLFIDGRFRYIEQSASEWLSHELSLVEAGHIDRNTAAKAGRDLQARYSVTSMIRRGRADVECYLRLINCESQKVVATADIYGPASTDSDLSSFFAAVAGHLRQIFPVIQTQVTQTEFGWNVQHGDRSHVRPGMRFFRLEKLPSGERVIAAMGDATEVINDSSQIKIVSGTMLDGEVISE